MSTNHSSIRLLTVDAAGTLVRPWPSVGAVYGRTAREHGIKASDDEVNTRFYQTFGKLQTCKKTNSGEESEFWRQVVTETFRPFAGDQNLDSLFEELWDLFAKGECWKLAEHALDTLTTLRKRGYQLAVLSNNDSRLRSVLSDLAIDQSFDHLFISSEMGCEKPEPEIFRKVEETMGRLPAEILHLGDSHSRDFLGARNAGWNALLFGQPKLEDDQITCFSELLDHLP
jgi:REG-2-like HAD superfamily hydrolase